MNELATVHADSRGTTAVVTIVGEIDMTNAEAITRVLLDSVGVRHTAIELDLTGIQYLDSSGTRMVHAIADDAAAHRRELHLIAPPSSPARMVLDLCGTEAVATIHDSAGRAR
jgi:anti-anti-sigma factor